MKNLKAKFLIFFLLFGSPLFSESSQTPICLLNDKSNNPIDQLMTTDPEIFNDSKLISKSAAERDIDLLNAEAQIYNELLEKGRIREQNRDESLYDSLIVPEISEQVFYFYLEAMLLGKNYSMDEIKLLTSDFHNLHFQKQLEFVHELVDFMAYNLPTYTGTKGLKRFKDTADLLQLSTDSLGLFIEKWNLMVLAEPSSLYWLVDSILYTKSKKTATHEASSSYGARIWGYFKKKWSKTSLDNKLISIKPLSVSKEISLRDIISRSSIFHSGKGRNNTFTDFVEKLNPVGLFYFLKKYKKFFNFDESKYLLKRLDDLDLLGSLDRETFNFFSKRHSLLVEFSRIPRNNSDIAQSTIDNLQKKISRLERKKTNQGGETSMNSDEFQRIMLLVKDLENSSNRHEVTTELSAIFKLMNPTLSAEQAYTIFENIFSILDKFKGKEPVLRHYLSLQKEQKKYPLTQDFLNKLIGQITTITFNWGDGYKLRKKADLIDASKWKTKPTVENLEAGLEEEINASNEKLATYLQKFEEATSTNEELQAKRDEIIEALLSISSD